MEEIVKPRRVVIDTREYVESLLSFEKDLQDNEEFSEEVCDTCHGTGIVKEDNQYFLREANGAMHGPYKHQAAWFCPNCYNGIVRRCKHCGKLITKGRLKCDCDTIKKAEKQQLKKLLQEAWDRAEELGPEALGTKFGMCSSSYYPYNEGYFRDWDSFFDAWDSEPKDSPRPQYVWGTREIEFYINADDIVENAVEELYEDAIDDISAEAMVELRTFLDDWCERCKVSKTYEESRKYKIRIPWEVYDGRN